MNDPANLKAIGPDLQACPSCQADNFEAARFCSHCGIRLAPTESVPEPTPASITRDAQPESVPGHVADPLIGAVVAERYRILEPLGRGGMSVVYKVEHARIGKLMALKLLTGELSRDPDLVDRFKREALMASRLSNPNTVQVFDFGYSDGLTYLAMEYLRGEDLGRLIRRDGPLSPARATRVMLQICSSLGEAHEKGIVHRDLKPENIILLRGDGSDELVKVLDFGLAKLRDSSELSAVTTRGAIVGTPFYMSPEQIRGEACEPRSDVYSLGALMHACLTGHPVFEAATPMAILTKHLTDEPVSPTQRFPELGIPATLSAIVLKALSKNADQRQASVRELQHALVEVLRDIGEPSDELLLDRDELEKLARAGKDAATRDEVEAYERKLRRRGQVAWAGLGVLVVSSAFLGWRVFTASSGAPRFAGIEQEPNNVSSEAQSVPFGAELRGQLGQRLDAERSDRDFFRIDVPADVKAVSLLTSALPNIALCTWVFPLGLESPVGRYCTGAPGGDLVVPALELAPGAYVVAVMQDREQYSDLPPPPVHENVSDAYRLSLQRANVAPDRELEPNDSLRDAALVAPGNGFHASLSWMHDVDVVCSVAPGKKVVFTVEDAGSRPIQAVLEVTPEGGPANRIPVRIHHPQRARSAHDVPSPWRSPAVPLDAEHDRACLKLRLVPNPAAPTPHPRVAPSSPHEYVISVEAS